MTDTPLQIYNAFAADPSLHERSDLGRFYRMGRDGVRCAGTSANQMAAYKAGKDSARRTP